MRRGNVVLAKQLHHRVWSWTCAAKNETVVCWAVKIFYESTTAVNEVKKTMANKNLKFPYHDEVKLARMSRISSKLSSLWLRSTLNASRAFDFHLNYNFQRVDELSLPCYLTHTSYNLISLSVVRRRSSVEKLCESILLSNWKCWIQCDDTQKSVPTVI